MNNNVFRKVSVERLSSPEQLDNLVRVTSPRGWLALCGIGLLIATALYWGIFGTMSTKVSGQGVLIRPGGLKTVHASSAGSISNIRVVEHDTVKRGDVIAWIEQPELLEQIKGTKRSIAALAGAATPDGGQNSNELAALEQQLRQLLADYEYASKVISPYTGKVIEVIASQGTHIGSGSSIVRLETHGVLTDELIAVMYVPVHQGKQLLPGMDVRISPSSINREEHGSLIGQVVSVSEFPVTLQGMMATLGNEGLVQQMAAEGVSLEVRVNLAPDNATFSGYKWTTEEGPPVRLNSGTIVNGAITVSSERPIASIIPQFK
ncbi:NHLP bacteriocin system secretion protein [Paenibacillus oenotherae]|uniref:NHLP bacteriocin system secretion protein n=1 Tax=Paenibacillus oenotherae TaxID=1435645 RepID=A0ABS7D2B5_9BACL|nr:NHLP bacteriocin system secretion protein [Paenibacillus oenotherae]MBW7474048.1 NHLP bacteriocin system secretion protein [Paenibacillus oenotherae]